MTLGGIFVRLAHFKGRSQISALFSVIGMNILSPYGMHYRKFCDQNPSNHCRTLSEANIDFSLPHKTPSHIPRRIIDSDQINALEKLNVNDFTITDTEQKSIDNLMTSCERHDMQWALLSKKEVPQRLVFPSLKNSMTLQELERKTEPSNIVYFKVFKDPADNADTMQKILDFLSELFRVGKKRQYLVVVGDRKTYEYLRKLKYQHRPALNWLIPFPGDWHICKNYQKVLIKIDMQVLRKWQKMLVIRQKF